MLNITTENPTINKSNVFWNNRTTSSPDIILSKAMNNYYVGIYNDVIYRYTLMPSMIYLIILLCIGLPGNLLVCYIYHTKRDHVTGRGNVTVKKKSSDIFILALAWLDILNCILSVPVEIYLLRYFVEFDFPWICKISRYSSMVFNAASSFVLLGIAIDRFIGIKYSHSRYRFNANTAVKFVCCSVILAVIISLPGLLLYGTQTIPLGAQPKIYGKTCLIEDHFVHTKYPLILTMFLTTVHLLFDVFFIVLYGIVGKKIIRNRNLSSVRTENKKRHSDKKQCEISQITFSKSIKPENVDRNENIILKGFTPCDYDRQVSNEANNNDVNSNRKYGIFNLTKKSISVKQGDSAVHGNVYKAGKTTFMLLAVTITFMLTFAPYCVIAILRSQSDIYSRLTNIEKAIYQLFLRSYLLSSAANPLIYSFLSDKFRQRCRQIFKRVFRC